jgi:hypothetical protein
MLDLYHPPIAFGSGLNQSLERQFAEEAYLLLANVSTQTEQVIGAVTFSNKVTNSAAMPNVEQPTLPMRVRSMPVLRIMSDCLPQIVSETSSDYQVMALEYDVPEAAESGPENSKKPGWTPYVLAVASPDNFDDVSILSAETGAVLELEDMVTAYACLLQVRQILRTERFEKDLRKDEACDPPDEVDQNLGNRHFISLDLLTQSICALCGIQNRACDHNPSALN